MISDFTIHILQFSFLRRSGFSCEGRALISQLSFISQVPSAGSSQEMVHEELLKSVNCKLFNFFMRVNS